MASDARRSPIFGAEPWARVAGVEWCHFDWWFALVITTDFDGDPDALRTQLESTLRSSLHRRDDTQAKLSHLAELRARLDAAALDFEDLAEVEEPDKRVLGKARRKVLEQALEGRAMTEAMRNTPAHGLEQRARYGHWDRFPTNPDRFYERLTGRRNDTFVPKGRSFDVTRRLRDRLDKLDGPRRALPDRLALYRAFHTVGLELAHRGDDSYGVIGELRLEAFKTYLAIDWATAVMEPTDYWQDLCELLVCEVACLEAAVASGPPPEGALLFVNLSASLLDDERVRAVLEPLADRLVIELSEQEQEQVDDYVTRLSNRSLAGERYTDRGGRHRIWIRELAPRPPGGAGVHQARPVVGPRRGSRPDPTCADRVDRGVRAGVRCSADR